MPTTLWAEGSGWQCTEVTSVCRSMCRLATTVQRICTCLRSKPSLSVVTTQLGYGHSRTCHGPVITTCTRDQRLYRPYGLYNLCSRPCNWHVRCVNVTTQRASRELYIGYFTTNGATTTKFFFVTTVLLKSDWGTFYHPPYMTTGIVMSVCVNVIIIIHSLRHKTAHKTYKTYKNR